MIYYGQYLCSIIVESLNYGYALKGGFFMEVRPRYALWKYDDEALPEDDLDLEDDLELMYTLSKKMGIEDIVRGDEFERIWRYLESIPADYRPMLESNVSYRKLTPEEKERFIELLRKD